MLHGPAGSNKTRSVMGDNCYDTPLGVYYSIINFEQLSAISPVSHFTTIVNAVVNTCTEIYPPLILFFMINTSEYKRRKGPMGDSQGWGGQSDHHVMLEGPLHFSFSRVPFLQKPFYEIMYSMVF